MLLNEFVQVRFNLSCKKIRRCLDDILALGLLAVCGLLLLSIPKEVNPNPPPHPWQMADGDERVSSNQYNFASKYDIDEY